MKLTDLFPLYKPEPPFESVTDGFGYKGVILQSRKENKIQCHVCGKLFKSVGRHIQHKHAMTVGEYRIKFDLNTYTPLVCEGTSRKIRNNFFNLSEGELEKRIELLKINNKKVHSNGLYKRRSPRTSIQYKNMFGTCNMQAKERFWKEYKNLGSIPTTEEMSGGLRSLVYTRFGSYYEALKTWGITEEEYLAYLEKVKTNYKLGSKKRVPKYGLDQIKKGLVHYFDTNGRLPSWEEARRLGFPHRSVFKRVFGTYNKKDLLNLIKRELSD